MDHHKCFNIGTGFKQIVEWNLQADLLPPKALF